MAFLTSYSGAKCGSAEDKYYFRFRFLDYCQTKIFLQIMPCSKTMCVQIGFDWTMDMSVPDECPS